MPTAPRISLASRYWVVQAVPPNRVAVGPDSWLDLDQLSRVIAARAVQRNTPLSEGGT